MFNIYSYEKKIKQEEEDAKRKQKEKKIEEMRKKMLPELAENYQKRIKKFIFDMANHPIKIKDCKYDFNTTRQEFMNDNNRKLGGSGKFSFRKYKTDKERIEEYLREKELNDKKTIKPKFASAAAGQKNEENKTHYSVEQPIMRFKPRTDLERLYYAINEYSFGKVPRDLVDEQLKHLNLNEVKKNEDEENNDLGFLKKFENIDERTVEELQTQKEFLNKQGYNEKNSETVKQITLIIEQYNKKHIKDEDDPSRFKSKQAWRSHVNKKAAKKFLGEYNKKTHFKAVSIFSQGLDEYKSKLNRAKLNAVANKTQAEDFLTFNSFDEPSNDEANNFTDFNYSNINSHSNHKEFNFNPNNGSMSSRFNRTGILGLNDKETLNFMSEFHNTTKNFSKTKNFVNRNNDRGQKDNYNGFVQKLNGFDFNPFNKKSEEQYDPKSLVYLKRISENTNITEASADKQQSEGNNTKSLGFLSNLKRNAINNKNEIINRHVLLNQNNTNELEEIRKYDEERITIDNETYLKSQVDLISKKILKKCNFTNTKSDFNNKNLKAGNGKLMITSGLTLNDFSKKYNFPK